MKMIGDAGCSPSASWAWKSRPLDARQPDVEHQAARAVGRLALQELGGRTEQLDLAGRPRRNRLLERLAHRWVVVDDEHDRLALAGRAAVGPRLTTRPAALSGRANVEGRAGAIVARSPYASSMRSRRSTGRSTIPCPCRSALVVKKALNRRSDVVGIDADAGVPHRRRAPRRCAGATDHEYAAAGRLRAPSPACRSSIRLMTTCCNSTRSASTGGRSRREVELQGDAVVLESRAWSRAALSAMTSLTVERRVCSRRLPGERAQPFDHLAGALAVADHALHRAARPRRAPARLRSSQRRPASPLVTMPASGWFTSWAIEALISPSVAARARRGQARFAPHAAPPAPGGLRKRRSARRRSRLRLTRIATRWARTWTCFVEAARRQPAILVVVILFAPLRARSISCCTT